MATDYQSVKQAMREEAYVELARLMKLMNSLSFLYRTIRDSDLDSNTSQNVMDRVSGSLLLTATLAEAVKRVETIQEHYKDDAAFADLEVFLNDPLLTAAKPYIRLVRNQIGFHADPEFFTEGLKEGERIGGLNDSDATVLFEHNTKWDAHANHYTFVDITAFFFSLRVELPSDELLLAFHSKLERPAPYWKSSPNDSEMRDRTRRAMLSTSLLCTSLIPAVQRLTRAVHKSMGAPAKPGPPPIYSPQSKE